MASVSSWKTLFGRIRLVRKPTKFRRISQIRRENKAVVTEIPLQYQFAFRLDKTGPERRFFVECQSDVMGIGAQ